MATRARLCPRFRARQNLPGTGAEAEAGTGTEEAR